MTFLAQLPEASFVTNAVLLLGFVSSVAANLYLIFGRKPTTPQPLSVEIVKQLVTHEQFERFEVETRDGLKALDMRISKVDQDRRESVNRCYKHTEEMVSTMRNELKDEQKELRAQFRQDVGGVHNRLTELLAAMVELRGAFNESRRIERGDQ